MSEESTWDMSKEFTWNYRGHTIRFNQNAHFFVLPEPEEGALVKRTILGDSRIEVERAIDFLYQRDHQPVEVLVDFVGGVPRLIKLYAFDADSNAVCEPQSYNNLYFRNPELEQYMRELYGRRSQLLTLVNDLNTKIDETFNMFKRVTPETLALYTQTRVPS